MPFDLMSQTAQEDAKLDAMQRAWQTKRGISSCLFENNENENLLALSQNPDEKVKFPVTKLSPLKANKENFEKNYGCDIFEEPLPLEKSARTEKKRPPFVVLDASTVGDFPARYTIAAPESHQHPVVGVYVHPSIVPGFKYRVHPLPAVGETAADRCPKSLFDGKALTLRSIGRGYARRFTFEADPDKLMNNDNYFWSDNRPEGYAFELELMSHGDKFTIFDANKEAQGTMEIVKIEAPQVEISSESTKHGVEKRANVRFTGKVEFFETGVAKPMPLSGIAIATKYKHKAAAEVIKVTNVAIQRHRYYLVPGIQKVHRRVTVRGKDIGDVPTKYSMTGLERYEMPVVGTYVDPRVIPGFHYKVRPNDRKEHLFGGRALRLLSIGMGYAKRLTFEPDTLLNPDNYLWSDNHPDGLGLEIRAVRRGMKFVIQAGDQMLGEASVFRADYPQIEEKMEKIEGPGGRCAIEKYVLIDVMCHVRIEIPGGGSAAQDEHLMRVCGLAVVRKEPNNSEAKVVRVENVGLDSQLNVLFAQTNLDLTFFPK